MTIMLAAQITMEMCNAVIPTFQPLSTREKNLRVSFVRFLKA